MTPQRFISHCESLYGTGWQSKLARELVRDIRTIRRWKSGESPVPHVVVDWLERQRREKEPSMTEQPHVPAGPSVAVPAPPTERLPEMPPTKITAGMTDGLHADNQRLRQVLQDCLLREDIAGDELGEHIRKAIEETPQSAACGPAGCPTCEVLPQAVISGVGTKIITPEDAEQLNVENSILRGILWLNARSLKDYRSALYVKAGEMLELAVPATLPARADDALARADAMLRNQKGRQV